MREILFRAKRTDNGEWICGYYAVIGEKHVIIKAQSEDYYSVDDDVKKSHGNEVIEVKLDTVSQYVDIEDKSGKKVFENDICEMVYDGNVYTYVVVWDKSELDFKGTNGRANYGREFEYLPCCDEIVVVGNVFDNPNLIKSE